MINIKKYTMMNLIQYDIWYTIYQWKNTEIISIPEWLMNYNNDEISTSNNTKLEYMTN